jgi:hypothetical protein
MIFLKTSSMMYNKVQIQQCSDCLSQKQEMCWNFKINLSWIKKSKKLCKM